MIKISARNTDYASRETSSMLEYIFKVLYEDSDDFDNFSSLKTYRDDFELSTMNGIGNDNSFFLPE